MGLLVNTMRAETNRTISVREEIDVLRHMTVGQLKDRYRDVFGEASRSDHKQFLLRRIAWRIQANAWGGLSERARRRALEIANDADLRIRAPKNFLKADLDEARAIETRVSSTFIRRLLSDGRTDKSDGWDGTKNFGENFECSCPLVLTFTSAGAPTTD
jgi:hypothetical protein